MLTATRCPHCGEGLPAPEHAGVRRIKCRHCNQVISLTPGVLASPAATKSPRRPIVLTAFCLGVAGLLAGGTACIVSLFPGSASFCRTAGTAGLLLGGTAVMLTLLRDECEFAFPFSGLVASVLALFLVVFWPGADTAAPDGRPPGWADKGPPPGWKGGDMKGKGGPWQPGGKGRGPGEKKGKGGPPPQPPAQ
jgi:hypothetical protein